LVQPNRITSSSSVAVAPPPTPTNTIAKMGRKSTQTGRTMKAFSFLAMTSGATMVSASAVSAEGLKDQLCPHTSRAMDQVVPIAPNCFRSCPSVCGPMDGVMITFFTTKDKNSARAKINHMYCQDTSKWDCMFQAGNFNECKKLLVAGKQLGTDPPQSQGALTSRCSSMSFVAAPEEVQQQKAFLAATIPQPMAAVATQGSIKDQLCPRTSRAMDQVVPIAPNCFRNCPAVCGPMDNVMITFFTTQDKNAARSSINKQYCHDPAKWDCMFQAGNFNECQKLLVAGKQLGTDPPQDRNSLFSRCSSLSMAATPPLEDTTGSIVSTQAPALLGADMPNPVALAQLEAQFSVKDQLCPKTSRAMDQVVPIAPSCFRACPAVCGPMDAVMIKFFTTQDKNAARGSISSMICRDQSQWDCMFQPANVRECSKLLVAGKQLGTDPPQSKAQLTARCASLNMAQFSAWSPGAIAAQVAMASAPNRTLQKANEEAAAGTPEVIYAPGATDDVETTTDEPQESEEGADEEVSTSDAPAEEEEVTTSEEVSTSAAPAEEDNSRAALCPNASVAMDQVVPAFPECFRKCPSICAPMDDSIITFAVYADKNQARSLLRQDMCAATEDWECMFEEENHDICYNLLLLGKNHGTDPPMSWDSLQSRCKNLDMQTEQESGASARAMGLLVAASAATIGLLHL